MGKINEQMRKSRENIKEPTRFISPDESSNDTVPMHLHQWNFAIDYVGYNGTPTSKFVCLCGAVKRVKQFEVEE